MEESRVTRKDFIGGGLLSAAGVLLGACQSYAQTGMASSTPSPMRPVPMRPDTTAAGSMQPGQYGNPYDQKVNIAWYKGRQVQHLFLGATNQKPGYKIAEQYLPLPKSAYTGAVNTPEEFMAKVKQVAGHGIFDSIPTDPNYSPIWHNNWVLVPDGYTPNTLKSVEDVRRSGYQVVETPIWVN